MSKNLLKASAVIAGGMCAGALTALAAFPPITDTTVAFVAARCMGWKPQGTHQEVPMLSDGMAVQSYRSVTVTALGTCDGSWTRELAASRKFPIDTPVTVFKGPGSTSYVLVKTSDASGTRTYMGTVVFGGMPSMKSSNTVGCWYKERRLVCKR